MNLGRLRIGEFYDYIQYWIIINSQLGCWRAEHDAVHARSHVFQRHLDLITIL